LGFALIAIAIEIGIEIEFRASAGRGIFFDAAAFPARVQVPWRFDFDRHPDFDLDSPAQLRLMEGYLSADLRRSWVGNYFLYRSIICFCEALLSSPFLFSKCGKTFYFLPDSVITVEAVSKSSRPSGLADFETAQGERLRVPGKDLLHSRNDP
jgi:hypothetical protein